MESSTASAKRSPTPPSRHSEPRRGSATVHPDPTQVGLRAPSPAGPPQQQPLDGPPLGNRVLCVAAGVGAVGAAGVLAYVGTLPFVAQSICICTTGVATGITAEGARRLTDTLCGPAQAGEAKESVSSRELSALRARVSVLESRGASTGVVCDDAVHSLHHSGASKSE